MNKNDFYDKLLKKTKEQVGNGWKLTITYVPKNNGIVHAALCIGKEDDPIRQSIYLDKMYHDFENGKSMDEIVADIRNILADTKEKIEYYADLDMMNWDFVKDKLAVRLVGTQHNKHYLNKVVWKPFLDLAAVVIICTHVDRKQGLESCKVSKMFLDKWNVTEEELYKRALENTRTLFHPKAENILDSFARLGFPKLRENTFDYSDMPIVLTNQLAINGASAMLDTDFLKEVYDKIGGTYFLLPSSIHEILAVRMRKSMKLANLHSMVYNINRTNVAPEEVLSDSVYYFDGTAVSVVMAAQETETEESL